MKDRITAYRIALIFLAILPALVLLCVFALPPQYDNSFLGELKYKKQLLQELKGKENITLDGRKIGIFANIGGVGGIGAVLANDAGGIGLFRSEFLYLESEDYPPRNSSSRHTKRCSKAWRAKR